LGLIEEFRGQKICLDTSPIIYFIEKDSQYWNLVRPVFIGINSGNIKAITSTLTLLEVLVNPFRNGNEDLAEKYREILLSSEGLTTFEILHETSELATRLRAKYSIKTPDAIQIAVGVRNGASKFLTNDSSLKKIAEIKVCVLDDYLVK
jgi:predicted nucleic acid-binding protein